MLVASVCTAVIIHIDPTRRLRVSFLDRLKREAEQQRLQTEALARERDERELLYRGRIEPQMKALAAYLEGLAATLLEVKPPISISMAIQGYGDLSLVPFWDYKVEHERRHRGFKASMTWSMKIDSERTPVVRADGVTRVKALISIFRQYHLGGIKEEKRTLQGELSCATFQARGYIKSRMEAQITAEDPVLRLMFENASWLGSSRRQVPWEQIDDGLFDRIARFIVREDDSLFTEELPDALRQRLRKDPEPTSVPADQTPTPQMAAAPTEPESPQLPPLAATPASTPAPAPPVVTPVQETQPEFARGFGQGMLAAPAPMTEGEVIEIDESKLGLSDFNELDDSSSAFSIRSLGRAPPAPALPTEPPAAATARPHPNPVQERRPAPAAATAPVQHAAPAAAAADANPHAAAAAHAAMLAQRAAAAARTAASQSAPAPATPTTLTPPPPSVPPASEMASTASANAGEAPDPGKEREAALFRLRMRAMMARLRTDEQDEPKT